MIGQQTFKDIPEAFRLLDTDQSSTIDIGELAIFMPILRSEATPYMLLRHIKLSDKDGDYELNYDEFNALLLAGLGQDIILGRT
ncbi:unnamed protein product [Rotaria sp. Silwood1]|nr:unnamed protein product [Rotaria sp. Silwood1]CAF1184810.1 unnamed protein product [Rotaria sp. Silwood1]